jgi:hypothetical protein
MHGLEHLTESDIPELIRSLVRKGYGRALADSLTESWPVKVVYVVRSKIFGKGSWVYMYGRGEGVALDPRRAEYFDTEAEALVALNSLCTGSLFQKAQVVAYRETFGLGLELVSPRLEEEEEDS